MGQGMVYKGHLIRICTPQSNSNLNALSMYGTGCKDDINILGH